MFNALINYTFFKNAFFAAILSSIACGIIGTIIIEKKLTLMSGGIAHTAFGGIGLGYFLGIEPIYTAFLFSVFASLSIAKIKRNSINSKEVPIAIFWSVGMALGIIFISFTPGYPPDMTSYLFGDILSVTKTDLYTIAILDIIIFSILFTYFNMIKSFLFDDEFSQVIGIKVNTAENILYIIIALVIVALIRISGIILVIALLSAPSAIAKFYTYDLKKLMILSVIIAIILSIGGLCISYYLNIPSGACIILLCGISYLAFARHK